MSEDTKIEQNSEHEQLFGQAHGKSKVWLRGLMIIMGLALIFVFYQFVIRQTMSPQEVQRSVKIVWHNTKWVDKSGSPYSTTIVPAITLKVKNTGEKQLSNVEFQGVFQFAETGQTHSEGSTLALATPLQPGEESQEILIKSRHGYSASSKKAFIQNSQGWKKMAVKILVRTKGSGLVPISGRFPIKQEIEGMDDTVKAQREAALETIKKMGKTVQIIWFDSKWVAKKVMSNSVLIVPTITFKIKNTGTDPVDNLICKGEFLFVETEEKLGEGFTPALKKALAQGETSEEITLKSDLGYTATSLEALSKNRSALKKVKVRIFVRKGDDQFVLLGIYQIKQQLGRK